MIREVPEAAMHSVGGGERSRRRALARRNGQKGGWASGRRRKALARGRCPARHRTRQTSLALRYKHAQLSSEKLRELYEREWPRPERASAAIAWEKGRETLVIYYRTVFTLYRAGGQHCITTKEQRSAALRARDRDRCPRTVRRLNQKLERLGLAVLLHERRGGSTPGNKDCLRVEIRTPLKSHVTPPPEGGSSKLLPSSELAAAAPRQEKSEVRNDPSPPPAAADAEGRHSAPERPVTEEEGLEERIRFAQMKLDAGFATAPAKARLRHLQAELRCLRQATESSASDPAPPGD